MLTRPLLLASASPRRAELLAQIGLSFTVHPSHMHEPPPAPGEDLCQWAQRAAQDKARESAGKLSPETPVLLLGADTVVVMPETVDPVHAPRLQGNPVTVLGKPYDASDAHRMLRRLAGTSHTVMSAFALLAYPEMEVISETVATHVHFRDLSDREIADYVATGEPLDKAGAYGIQGRGAVLVERIEGDYFNVVGLPLTRLWISLAPWRR